MNALLQNRLSFRNSTKCCGVGLRARRRTNPRERIRSTRTLLTLHRPSRSRRCCFLHPHATSDPTRGESTGGLGHAFRCRRAKQERMCTIGVIATDRFNCCGRARTAHSLRDTSIFEQHPLRTWPTLERRRAGRLRVVRRVFQGAQSSTETHQDRTRRCRLHHTSRQQRHTRPQLYETGQCGEGVGA